jgi:hypothetical protein
MHIYRRKPILSEGRRDQFEEFSELAWGFPYMAKNIEDDSGVPFAIAVEIRENSLDIPQIVEQIGKYDHVKVIVTQVEALGICADELEIGILVLCLNDHFR